jgi:phenylacetaldehyde dehydrogenase
VRATDSTPLPVEVLVDDGQSRAELHYRPIGVVGAITPWNWPMIIACWQIAPALRMGNTVVQKASEYTTLTGLAIAAVLNEALPPGVLTAVTGAGDVGDALVRDPRVGKVMFTGSVKTGMKVIEASAGNMPRLTLELGGNDAAIVLPDVDPQAIAEGLFWGAFINNGQTCAAMKRLYVPDAIYDEVVDALAALAAKIPMGVGLDEGNVLGPLQNQMQWNVVNRLVEDAKVRGARVVMGGDPDAAAPGYFYPKTLVADIDNAAPLVQEEQFGPALPIIRYTDLEQAVEWANGVDVGLGASVWSADRDTALAIAARLQAGTVWINSQGGIDPRVPFGGAKRSGYGPGVRRRGTESRIRPAGHQRLGPVITGSARRPRIASGRSAPRRHRRPGTPP